MAVGGKAGSSRIRLVPGTNAVRLAAAVLCFFFCSCNRASPDPEKHYQLTGVILALDPKQQTANVKHAEIPGWMEAMTMDYPVRSKEEFASLRVGDHISATVSVHGTDYELTDIKKQSGSP
jgi:Cu/Ag efflux protein CusF